MSVDLTRYMVLSMDIVFVNMLATIDTHSICEKEEFELCRLLVLCFSRLGHDIPSVID